MDSWNLTDTEHLTDTESTEDATPDRPVDDAGYEVDEMDVVEEVEDDEVDITDQVAEAESQVYDEDQDGEQLLVDTAPAAPSAPATPAPEASIDEVEGVLDQVDEALARLDDGTYGRCVNCGRPIQDDRLAEDPTDQRCDECVEPVLIGVD